MILVLNKFPTHIKRTNNKVKADRYWKINSQGIYNSSIQKFTRGIVMDNIHSYIIGELEKQKLPSITSPVQLILRIYIPKNYSTIRRNKDGCISWKKATKDYTPNNDADNINWIWEKAIKDCLTKLNVWEDDNLQYCKGTDYLVEFIDELEDRRIEISFKKL